MDELEMFWANMLSQDPPTIEAAWKNLSSEEQTTVREHLQRMATEEGWADVQRLSAQSALDTIRSLSDQ